MYGILTDGSRPWSRSHPALATLRARSAAVVALVVSNIGVDELLLAAALTLVAVGFSKIWLPGAYLVPGLVLLWIVLPSRAPFIARPPALEKDRRKKD